MFAFAALARRAAVVVTPLLREARRTIKFDKKAQAVAKTAKLSKKPKEAGTGRDPYATFKQAIIAEPDPAAVLSLRDAKKLESKDARRERKAEQSRLAMREARGRLHCALPAAHHLLPRISLRRHAAGQPRPACAAPRPRAGEASDGSLGAADTATGSRDQSAAGAAARGRTAARPDAVPDPEANLHRDGANQGLPAEAPEAERQLMRRWRLGGVRSGGRRGGARRVALVGTGLRPPVEPVLKWRALVLGPPWRTLRDAFQGF